MRNCRPNLIRKINQLIIKSINKLIRNNNLLLIINSYINVKRSFAFLTLIFSILKWIVNVLPKTSQN